MMEPAIGPFVKVMRSIALKPPQIPYISNVTGDWITDEQATDPAYWGLHLRSAVQFYKGLSTIQNQFATVLLEVGPSRALGTLARSLASEGTGGSVQSSLPHAAAKGAGELKSFLRAAAELWLAGVPIEWERRYQGERRRKRPLPTYPFARQRYWALEDPTPAPAPNRRDRGSPGGRGGRRSRARGARAGRSQLFDGDGELEAGAVRRRRRRQSNEAGLVGVRLRATARSQPLRTHWASLAAR